jgi:hypothetical protein
MSYRVNHQSSSIERPCCCTFSRARFGDRLRVAITKDPLVMTLWLDQSRRRCVLAGRFLLRSEFIRSRAVSHIKLEHLLQLCLSFDSCLIARHVGCARSNDYLFGASEKGGAQNLPFARGGMVGAKIIWISRRGPKVPEREVTLKIYVCGKSAIPARLVAQPRFY